MGPQRVPLGGVLIQSSPLGGATTDQNGEYSIEGPTSPPVLYSCLVNAVLLFQEYTLVPPQARYIREYPEFDPNHHYPYDSKHITGVRDIIVPAPILMQAGWWGLDHSGGGIDTWTSMYNYLMADPQFHPDKNLNKIPSFITLRIDKGSGAGQYDASASAVANHDKNGALLASDVTGLDQAILSQWLTPQNIAKIRPSIIAHSMGGLIARSAVTRSQTRVGQIACLDCPHGGSKWAKWIQAPALREDQLNGTSIDCMRVVSGGWNWTHSEPASSDRSWLLYTCIQGGIVAPDASAWGFGRILRSSWPSDCGPPLSPHQWIDATQTAFITACDDHSGIYLNQTRQREVAQWLKEGNIPSGEACIGSNIAGIEDDLGGTQLSLSVGAGGTATQLVQLDTNAILLVRLLVAGSAATIDVQDTQGNSLPFFNHVTTEVDSSTVMQSFEVWPPSPGTISVTLSDGGTSGATLVGAALFANGRALRVHATPQSAQVGQPRQIQVQLEDATGAVLVGTPRVLQATVVDPLYASSQITLFDDGNHLDQASGDGIYGATFVATSVEGRYHVTCNAIITVQSENVERSSDDVFVVVPTGASFNGTPLELGNDADGNGQFESISFGFGLALQRNGVFLVSGEIQDSNGQLLGVVSDQVDNAAGAGVFQALLTLPARSVLKHGVSGPWHLTHLTLYDVEKGSLPMEVAPDFTTQAWQLAQFQSPPSPLVSDVLPKSGPQLGGNLVTVFGAHFEDATDVVISGRHAAFQIASSEMLRVTMPASALVLPLVWGPSGMVVHPHPPPVDIRVYTRWGQSVLTAAYSYVH